MATDTKLDRNSRTRKRARTWLLRQTWDRRLVTEAVGVQSVVTPDAEQRMYTALVVCKAV